MKKIRAYTTVCISLIILGILLASLAYYGRKLQLNLIAPRDGEFRETVLDVAPGATVDQVCQSLEDMGIINDAFGLQLYYRLFLQHKSIKYGEYLFSTSMTPIEILEHLISGKVILHRFTVPEGLQLKQIAEVFNLTEPRVSQLHAHALFSLSAKLRQWKDAR